MLPLAAGSLEAQAPFTITGIVIDETTGEPIVDLSDLEPVMHFDRWGRQRDPATHAAVCRWAPEHTDSDHAGSAPAGC